MAAEFLMPKLGLTMEQGTIVSWLAADGDAVDAGAPVLVVETDKVETEIEAPAAGRLHRVGVEGETFDCGALVAWLLADGEDPPAVTAAPVPPPAAPAALPARGSGEAGVATLAAVGTAAAGGRLWASPNARRVARAAGVDLALVRGTGPGGRIVSEDVEEHVAARPAVAGPWPGLRPASTAVPATMAARLLADLLGVDVRVVPASAPDGRVSREDVAVHVRQLLARSAARPAVAPEPVLQEPTEVVPLSGMRGTIAMRMHRALHEMAQLTLTMDADMGAVVADREARRAAAGAGRPPGFTDYVVAAAARALREHPIVNSQVTDSGIALLPRVHVGVAVAVDRGLLVPVIRDADTLALDALAVEAGRLAERARSGGLRLDELEGATFSVSALGMYGVDAFTPVVNPPNTAILGVGRLHDDVAWDDRDVPRRVRRATLSLTWDHRVLDGAPAAEFCRTVVGYLEEPARLA